MNAIIFRTVISVLFFFFSANGFAQSHDHVHAPANPAAEKIWNQLLSREIILQNAQQSGSFTRSELNLLFLVFEEQYQRDFFKFYSSSLNKSDPDLRVSCTQLSEEYKNLFKLYSINKEKYLAEGRKLLQLQQSLNNVLEINGPCNNIGFENGDMSGWVPTSGTACTNPSPCSQSPALALNSHVIQSYGYDPLVGNALPVVAPGGKYSLRIGDFQVGGKAASISQTFLVTPSNSNFTLQYAVVLEDPGEGHTDEERPYFGIRMKDGSGNSIPCAEYRVMAKPPISNFVEVNDGFYYRPWTIVSIPLNNYIGQNVTITFDVSDCVLLGHRAYAYIDGSCIPFQVQTDYHSVCNAGPVQLNAPEGYATYQWTGTGIIGATNQETILVNQAGTYNVSIAAVTGSTCTASFGINLTTVANTFAGNDTTICAGNSVQLKATGVGTDVVWSPVTGLSDAAIPDPVANPTVTTTYTVTSCGVSDQITVYVNPGFDITMPADINLCDDSTAQLSVTPLQPDNYTYAWRPLIGLDNAEIQNPVAIVPGTVQYSVYVTRESDGCVQEGNVKVAYTGRMPKYDLIAFPDKTCAGGEIVLSVVGAGFVTDSCEVADNSKWIITGGSSSSVCGSAHGNAYFFDGASERSAVLTDWFDAGHRVGIVFYLKVSTGTAPCENADEGEDIVLEYTLDEITWNVFGRLNQDQFPVFKMEAFITPPVGDVQIKIRIRQLTFSAAGEDTWAIDNIGIFTGVATGNSGDPLYYFNRQTGWTPSATLEDPGSLSTLAYPVTNTTYTLTISDNITQCVYKDSVKVEVVPGFDIDMSDDVTLCEGDTTEITLTVVQGGTYIYSWLNTEAIMVESNTSALAYPQVTTDYVVQVESEQGCVRRDTARVNVIQLTAAYAAVDESNHCANQTAQLSLRKKILYDSVGTSLNPAEWSLSAGTLSSVCGSVSGNAITFNQAGARSLTVNTLLYFHAGMNVEFYLKISDGNGCDDAEPGDNVVLECFNGSSWINLGTYNEDRYPGFTYINVPVTGVADGTLISFRWRQLAHSGANQDVWALDNIAVTEPVSPSAYTYAWTPSQGLDDNTISTPVATLSSDIWYSVTITKPGGCPEKDSVFIKVGPDFQLSAQDPVVNTCINAVTTLDVQTDLTAGTYTAKWTPATGLDNANTLTPQLTVEGSSVYNLVVTSLQGCTKNLSVTVTPAGVSSTVTLTVSKDTVCAGETVTFNAKITPADCGTTAICLGTDENTFTTASSNATVSNPFGGSYREGRTQLLYTKTELLALGIQPGDLIKSIAFEAVVKNSTRPYENFTVRIGCTDFNVMGTSFISGNTEVYTPKSFTTVLGWNELVLDYPYIWNGTSNLVIELCYDNSASSYHDYVASGITTFYSAVSATAASGTIPGCNLTSGSYSIYRPVTRISTCAGTATSTDFSWTPSTGLSDPASFNPSAEMNTTGTYTFTLNGNTDCPVVKSETIQVVSLTVDALQDTTVCYASPAHLHATYDIGYEYIWTPSESLSNSVIYNPIAYPEDTTTYMVEISDGVCTGYDTVTVNVTEPLAAGIEATPTSGQPPLYSVLNSQYTAASYVWYTQQNPVPFSTAHQTGYTISEPGEAIVYLEVRDSYGCRAIDSVYLSATYLFIPNLITPNGDGENDIFYLVLFGHQWDVKIYNRWNAKVYDNENYQNEWGGENVSDGIYYYYIIEKFTNKEYKGWLHVIKEK